MNISGVLIKFILIFKKENEADQNNVEIYGSEVDARLSDCVKDLTDGEYCIANMRMYDDKEDRFRLYGTNEQHAQSPEKKAMPFTYCEGTSTQPATAPDRNVIYMEMDMPVSKAFYHKIIRVSLQPCFYLSAREIYVTIMSGLCDFVDNRRLLINRITTNLSADAKLFESLHNYHQAIMCSQFAKIKGFDVIKAYFDGHCNLANSANMMEIILVHLAGANDDTSVQRRIEQIRAKNDIFQSFVSGVKIKYCLVTADSCSHRVGEKSLGGIFSDLFEQFPTTQLHNNHAGCCWVIDSEFLACNQQLFEPGFYAGSTPSSVSLEIDFRPLTDERAVMKMEKARDVINKVLCCEFVCGNHITQLTLYISELNMELDTTKIRAESCIIHLDNCGSKVLSTLPAKIEELYMKSMFITDTVTLSESLVLCVCKNVTLKADTRIVVPNKTTNLVLCNVDGVVQSAIFGTVTCLPPSEISYKMTDFNGLFTLQMRNVQYKSASVLSGCFACIILEKVVIAPPHQLELKGDVWNISISTCSGSIDLMDTKCLESLQFTQKLNSNLKIRFPPTIRGLYLSDVCVQQDLIINCLVRELHVNQANIATGCTFKLVQECSNVTIRSSVGVFILNGMIMESTGRSQDESFAYKRTNNGLCNISAVAVQLESEKRAIHNIKAVYLKGVVFKKCVIFGIDDRIRSFYIDHFNGIVSLTGIVVSTLTGGETASFKVERPVLQDHMDITAVNLLVKEPTEIKCNLGSLLLQNVKCHEQELELRVYGMCEFIGISNYTGLLDIAVLNLIGASFENAILDYKKATNYLNMYGKIGLNGHSLPDNIRYVALSGITVTKNTFYLHKMLREIEIVSCKGHFNFKGLFGIYRLAIEPDSNFILEGAEGPHASLKLRNMVLHDPFNTSNRVNALTLKNLSTDEQSVLQIDSECHSAYIQQSECGIAWVNGTETSKMNCYENECCMLQKSNKPGLFLLKMTHTCLSRRLVLLGCFESVVLEKIQGQSDCPIVINSACTSVLIQGLDGVLSFPDSESLNEIYVDAASMRNTEIHLTVTTSFFVKIEYEFMGGGSVEVHIWLTRFSCLRFSCEYSNKSLREAFETLNCSQPKFQLTALNDTSQDGTNSHYLVNGSDLDVFAVLNEHLKMMKQNAVLNGHLKNDKTKYQAYLAKSMKQITISRSSTGHNLAIRV